MKAIITRIHPATNTRAARISVRAHGLKPAYFKRPMDLDGEAEHRFVAEAFARSMGWPLPMASGGLPDGTGYAFCFVTEEAEYVQA
jgi:hypothetical protein